MKTQRTVKMLRQSSGNRLYGDSMQLAVWLLVSLSLASVLAMQRPAQAITINIEYSTDFDGEENPAWDENGFFLISHFQAAKQIWETLLPGEAEVSFDFQWDDDIDDPDEPGMTLGKATRSLLDTYIEINPQASWFVDLTPLSNEEFGASTQVFYGGLTPTQRTTYFPDLSPPNGLEVGYKLAGPPGMAADFDLLTVILHEMGHVHGVNSDTSEPYLFNAQHVGGIGGISVLNDNDSGHLAGDGDLPVLMCNNCAAPGERVLPSATDVLAIANVLEINDVRLQRVGRISAGNWNNANAWIGGDVPDAAQDAEAFEVSTVTLDVNASVKSLLVDGNSHVDAAGFQLASASTILFEQGALSVGAGGFISTDTLRGNPAQLYTAAGSTVGFNDFTPGASAATAATFNGNVQIGIGTASSQVVFNPNAIATWNVGQNLTVGNPKPPTGSGSSQRSTKLVIDNGVWNVGGNLEILKKSEVMVDGGFLNVTGPVTVYGALTYRGRVVSNTTYTIFGGTSTIETIPPPTHLETSQGGRMTFENTTQGTAIGASVDSATIIVGGGTGDGAPGAVVTFKGVSHADDGEFWNRSGVGGASLRISNPLVIAGTGGRTTFEDNATAGTSHFRNDGVAEHGTSGSSGGATQFRGNSIASSATFDNYGSTLQSYTGAVPAPGGRTEFFDTAGASLGTFNNHPGQGMGSLGAGVTTFSGTSTASSATFYNKGGVPGAQYGGSVEFYDTATADDATFYNEHAVGVSQNAGSAGNVRFYNSSTAANATFHNQVGGGAVYFNDSSTAGDAHFFIERDATSGGGGHVIFTSNSKGGTSDITIRPNAFSSTIEFYGTSNAEQAEITLENGWNGFVRVTNSASLGNATVDVGSGSGGNLIFRESATAADSLIFLRPGGGADFTGVNTTAGNATIRLDGATVANGGTGSLNFSGGRAGNSTIYVNGGLVAGAAGAQVNFNNGANVGTATVIGGSGAVPGAGGGRITIDPSSNLSSATLSVGAGGYLDINGLPGVATVGSLDVAGGSVFLKQVELRVGGLNTSNTISGPISGFFNNGNAKITKVGTGTLTLSGTNTYYGLTKVDGGTLVQNGTNPGPAEVNSGAILGGGGTFSGAVTVNNGGTLAPGASPGTMTIGSLTMNAGSTLLMELGGTTPGSGYDRIQSSGALAFAGTLQLSLYNGFMPAAGQSFDLFNWGTVSGAFSSLSLPTLAGLAWNTSQLYTTGVVSLDAANIPGDFNGDGTVDAADYVSWRKNDGTQTAYNTWRANFGQTAGTGTQSGSFSSAVPEPSSLAIALFAAAVLLAAPLRRVPRASPVLPPPGPCSQPNCHTRQQNAEWPKNVVDLCSVIC